MNYDQDMRGLDSMIDAAVRGILAAFGALTFEDVLVRVCYQLALSATRFVIESVHEAYNNYIDKYKKSK